MLPHIYKCGPLCIFGTNATPYIVISLSSCCYHALLPLSMWLYTKQVKVSQDCTVLCTAVLMRFLSCHGSEGSSLLVQHSVLQEFYVSTVFSHDEELSLFSTFHNTPLDTDFMKSTSPKRFFTYHMCYC